MKLFSAAAALFARVPESFSVLTGRTSAIDHSLIDALTHAAKAAQYTTPTMNQLQKAAGTEPAGFETPDTSHQEAKAKITAVKNYLQGLPVLFLGLLSALTEARQAAALGSTERAKFQEQIDRLNAQNDELEGLIGEAATAFTAADQADNAFDNPVVPTPPGDVLPGGGGPVTVPTEEPPTGGEGTAQGATGLNGEGAGDGTELGEGNAANDGPKDGLTGAEDSGTGEGDTVADATDSGELTGPPAYEQQGGPASDTLTSQGNNVP